MKTTKQLLDEFNISRQTLMNWLNAEEIKRPEKDWRGWYIWDEENIEEIRSLIIKRKSSSFQGLLEKHDNNIDVYNRRYLGSKKRLLSFIEEVVEKHTSNVNTVADIFGGDWCSI
ncbi:hypothetical protein [Staphylococcus chromogenes]|uniref:hypothetical protein n=1 Tax=Staphylococcus chromogenes TaxID=46126 RepID=UPI0018E58B0D|nr:hypothetical protein [Staphylococcus chromogenes]